MSIKYNGGYIPAVGADGQILVADSSTSTGLRYNPTSAAGKNAIINGGMDIWQRGTTATTVSSYYNYGADRWRIQSSNTTLTASQQSPGSTLPQFRYCQRIARNAASTQTSAQYISQSLENATSIPFAGQNVTISFYARAGANYSSTSNALTILLNAGTGTDENVMNGYTGSTTSISATATLTTSWQRFSYSGSVASTVTELGFLAYYTPTGTAGANDYFEITGVQLELGSTATTFSRAGGSIGGELALCQRYYQRISPTVSNSILAMGYAISTTVGTVTYPLKTTMRAIPTVLDTASTILWDQVNVSIGTTSMVINAATTESVTLSATVASGLTQYRPYVLIGSSGASVGVGAEL